MDTVQILKDARALIADEKNWIQGYYSCDADHAYVLPDTPEAFCFCALGAILKVSGLSVALPIPDPLVSVLINDEGMFDCAEHEGEAKIAYFNDHKDHNEVLGLFDRAIARAESEAA